jgi:hypothetical protein
MSRIPDSGAMGLDGDEPLSADERMQLRRMLREDDRMNWARRKLRYVAPMVVALIVAVWQLIEWVRLHISFK